MSGSDDAYWDPPRKELNTVAEVIAWLEAERKTLWVPRGQETIEPNDDDKVLGRKHLWTAVQGGSTFVAKDDDGLFGAPSGMVVPPPSQRKSEPQ